MHLYQIQKNTVCKKATLYAVVFDAPLTKLFAALLLTFILLQPVAFAFANEETTESPAEPTVVPEVAEEPAVEEVQEVEEVPEQVEEIDEVETEVVATTSNEEDIVDEDPVEESSKASSTATEEVAPTPTSTPQTADDTSIATSSASSTTGEVLGTSSTTVPTTTTSSEAPNSVASTTQATTSDTTTDENTNLPEETTTDTNDENTPTTPTNATDPSSSSTTGTSSEKVVKEIVYVQSTPTDDSNRYQFGVNECVSVGDDSFYCNKESAQDTVSETNIVTSRVDANGDHEIYLQLEDKTHKLTDNTYEDLSPYFDVVTQTVVWHRLVDGRYQIIVYDVESEKETQITDTSSNNMQPTTANDYVVWQRWVDSNWEIILYDGKEELQISHNAAHDVAPFIRGGYVIWSVTSGNTEKTVNVYEIETGLLNTIDDASGGHITNPRFVLVYDTTYDNGDIVTKGFDPKTGEVVPLSAIPAETPTNIPTPDSTGETRALIQNKTLSREDFSEKVDGDTATSGTSTKSFTNSTSTEAFGTSTQQQATSTNEIIPPVSMASTTDQTLPLTDFDLIVEPYSGTTSAQSDISASSTNLVE